MKASERTIQVFIDELCSSAPVPGGGGVAALCGALSAALGGMVCSLTLGKKKYESVQADILRLNEEAAALSARFLALIDRDAEAFAPLAAAYRLPGDTPERLAEKERAMQEALAGAVRPPLDIMQAAAETVTLLFELVDKGSVLAVSDVGVAAALAVCVLRSGQLNVLINTKAMADRENAERINRDATALWDEYGTKAETVYKIVANRLS